MMFLLKMTFWVMLVFLLLPGSPEDNRKLMTSAEKTVDDLSGFCVRNPDVCSNARLAVTSLLSRVKSGAELMEGWVSKRSIEPAVHEQIPEPRQPTIKMQDRSNGAEKQPLKGNPQWHNSLSTADRDLPWRGPSGL